MRVAEDALVSQRPNVLPQVAPCSIQRRTRFPFRIGERFSMRVGRWHQFLFILSNEPMPEFAGFEISGSNDRDLIFVALCFLFQIETQLCLPVARVRAMAMKTPIR